MSYNDLTLDQEELLREAKAVIRSWSRERKLKFCRDTFNGQQNVIRDFVIFDCSNHPGFRPWNSLVMHLPSMLFRGFYCSFETSLRWIQNPEYDKDLIRLIYDLPPVS
jgi:hypothetical protein